MKIQFCIGALLLTTTAGALAPTPAAQPTPVSAARGPALDVALEAARVAVDACTAIGQKVGVSVIDSGGVLKALLAADGASPRGVQSSTNKAVTALTFKDATSQLGERVKTDKELADKVAADSNFNTRAGGVLLKVDGVIVGAIGVGGAKGSENDEKCALAALEKVQPKLR